MARMDSYLGWKIDFENPPGEPAFTAPDSVSWRVFKNPIALGIGGIAAVLLEFADPRIRSGVWDHSTYKADPIGRSRRTGMAAMVGVYGPQSAARRVIKGVTNMHARVEGATPHGESYKALEPDLLDWVNATAKFGFVTAYDRFAAKLSEDEIARFYAEGEAVARLYGVVRAPQSNADFHAMLERLSPRFEPHPIVDEFLAIVQSGPGALGVPLFVRRAMAQAAVSILPNLVRERLRLGAAYDLAPASALLLKAMAGAVERTPLPNAPPARACRRLGLPANFLYRSRAAQQRLLRAQRPQAAPSDAAA